MVISKENKKEIEKIQGKKCSICDNYFSYEDLKKKNYEIVTSKITKRKSYYHSDCIKKRGVKNG